MHCAINLISPIQTPPKKSQRTSADAEFRPDCKSTELQRTLQRFLGSVDEPEIEGDKEAEAPATCRSDPYLVLGPADASLTPGEADTMCGQPLFQFCSRAQQQLLV